MTPVPGHLYTWVKSTLSSGRYFFLIDTDGSRRSCVSGALSNRKHGLFHIRYFENGTLEPGSVKREKVEKSPLSKETTPRASLEPRSSWDVSPSATHASTGLTEISISRLTYSGSRNGKIYLNNYWMKLLWYPITVFLYNIIFTRNTHSVWHCPQKSCSALAIYRLVNYLLAENWQTSPVGCADFQN